MLIRVSASSALNGSSSSSRPGSRTSARASAARWASPPDSVSGHASAALGQPDLVQRGAAAALRVGGRASPSATLSQHPLPRHQPRLLERHRDRRRRRCRSPVDLAVQPGQRAQQRRLAACRCGRSGRRTRPARCPGPGRPGHRRSPKTRRQAARTLATGVTAAGSCATRLPKSAAPCQQPSSRSAGRSASVSRPSSVVHEQRRRRSRRCG